VNDQLKLSNNNENRKKSNFICISNNNNLIFQANNHCLFSGLCKSHKYSLLVVMASLRDVRGDKREPSVRGYNWATLFLGDVNTGNLALQVGGVSDETIKYGREFCGTSTQE
jgi:hypothetical protein